MSPPNDRHRSKEAARTYGPVAAGDPAHWRDRAAAAHPSRALADNLPSTGALRASLWLALAYTVAGWMSLYAAVAPGYVAVVYPAAGVALGLSLLVMSALTAGVFGALRESEELRVRERFEREADYLAHQVGRRLVAPRGNRRLSGAAGCEADDWMGEGLATAVPIDFASRRWEVRVRATPGYATERDAATGWIVIVVGTLTAGALNAFLLVATGQARRAEGEIRQLAYYDALTGLANRRLWLQRAHSTA
ncbi:MAG TPA: GGDEF domain-containing protein [Rhodocyclaceae bacterium]|nr:GGDEF domain-containing protein [Rhodocyclaceae bacterium]